MRPTLRTPLYLRAHRYAQFICACFVIGLGSASHATDPMTSAQSHKVREAFAACREKPTEMTRFLCNCDVVEQQCLAALKPNHGQWRTIEVWHGETEDDREVYFHLPPVTGDPFTPAPFDQGMLISCLLDTSALTIHLGESVDVRLPVTVTLDGALLNVDLVEENMSVMAIADATETALKALSQANEAVVSFVDEWGDEVELIFRPVGLEATLSGWEPLCKAVSS